MTAIAFRLLACGLAASLLASCATISPESRLRAGLVDAGLSPRMAECMAQRMADRLSLMQLRRLQSLASLRKSHMSAMSVDTFLYKVRALDDPDEARHEVLKCETRAFVALPIDG